MVDYASSSRFVEVEGIRIHYNEVGEGYPLILVHGAGPGASSWSNFQRNYEAFAAYYRVIMLDMPQYGGSDKVVIREPRLAFTSRLFAQVMDRLDIARAHYVGNSMGGQVGIKFAIDYPGRLSRLVVMGSCPVSSSLFSPMPVEGVRMIGRYYKGGGGPSLEKMRDLVTTFLYHQELATDALIEERYQASIDPEIVELFGKLQPSLEKEDLSADFSRVTVPTLIVWGMDDRFGPLDIGLLMLRRFPDARMHIFNHCGHWTQVEYADEFNRLVLDFLQ